MSDLPPNADPVSPPANAIDVRVDPVQQSPTPAAPKNVLRGPRRQFVIVFGIAATIIMSTLAITLLYMKWYRTDDYNVLIIAYGEDDWDGAIVQVRGVELGGTELTGMISSKMNLTVRFHVPPGGYTVTARKGILPNAADLTSDAQTIASALPLMGGLRHPAGEIATWEFSAIRRRKGQMLGESTQSELRKDSMWWPFRRGAGRPGGDE